MAKTITVEVNDVVYGLLEALAHGTDSQHTVEDVVSKLIDHAQQGVYRPGAWERAWLEQAFGDDWIDGLEVGDPYERSGNGSMFNRPKQQ
jgi:hypothetical protein